MTEFATASTVPAHTIADAAGGDAAAFTRIVHAHHDDMVRICQVITGDPDAAQDAAQAAWPIAWQKLRSLREPDRLRQWLMAIAVNEARQTIRRRRQIQVVTIEVADLEWADTDPASRTADADLLAAVRRLTADERSILALRYVAGYDAVEIGRALGMSASGVRSRLSRIVARLREELQDD